MIMDSTPLLKLDNGQIRKILETLRLRRLQYFRQVAFAVDKSVTLSLNVYVTNFVYCPYWLTLELINRLSESLARNILNSFCLSLEPIDSSSSERELRLSGATLYI